MHLFAEKDAISGVLYQVTAEYNVPLGVLRGYCSETFAYEMAEQVSASGKPTFIYQFGDHDPSGVGAWNDFQKKVVQFAPDAELAFERLAVTPQQIEDLSLPTRPTKKSDTRSHGFAGESVEVDAIPAPIMRDIARAAIEQHIDQRALDVTKQVESSERELLFVLAGRAEDGEFGDLDG